MNAAKRKPTAAQQQKRAQEERPQITLVPSVDDADEQHEKAGKKRCGALAHLGGEFRECELPARHGGDHEADGRTWRPRSGDAR